MSISIDLAPLTICVLGAGSWGTALAWLLGEQRRQVRLWCRDAERAIALQRDRVNTRYLPTVELPPSVTVDASLAAALEDAAFVLVAVPTGALRSVLTAAAPHLGPGTVVLIAAKGLERETGLRVSQVAAEATGRRGDGATGRDPGPGGVVPSPDRPVAPSPRLAVISGPNLAGELVRRTPTVSVVASADREVAARCQAWLAAPFFRVYTNTDVIGVELGGALKNVMAIGAGICDGLGFGDNTKAALITRGLAEMARLAEACGARRETLMGISGLGDLVATCASGLSRNHRLGVLLGRGETLEAAQDALGQVAEGVPTADAARRLAAAHGVETPIIDEVYRVLYEGRSPHDAVASLMSRQFRDE